MWQPEHAGLLTRRVIALPCTAERRWGSMSLAGMLAHCTLALDVYSKGYELPDHTHWYTPVTRWHALSIFPFPHGVKLPVELPTETGLDIENERAKLLEAIAKFSSLPADHQFRPHFMLGPLYRDEYGILAYKHTDHHLRQFGG